MSSNSTAATCNTLVASKGVVAYCSKFCFGVENVFKSYNSDRVVSVSFFSRKSVHPRVFFFFFLLSLFFAKAAANVVLRRLILKTTRCSATKMKKKTQFNSERALCIKFRVTAQNFSLDKKNARAVNVGTHKKLLKTHTLLLHIQICLNQKDQRSGSIWGRRTPASACGECSILCCCSFFLKIYIYIFSPRVFVVWMMMMRRKHPTLRQSIFRFVGGVLLEMIESAFHSSPLFRVKKNLARRVRFQQRYICCNCDEFPSSRGGVLFPCLPAR